MITFGYNLARIPFGGGNYPPLWWRRWGWAVFVAGAWLGWVVLAVWVLAGL